MKKKFLAIISIAAMLVAMIPSMVFATVSDTDVAKIGDTGYATLQEAVTAGGEITLLKDVTESIMVPAANTVTINLNNYSITSGTGDTITNHGTLTISGSGNVSSTADGKGALVNMNGANVTLKGGTFNSEKWYTLKNHGTMLIESPTVVQAATNGSSLVVNGWYSANTATLHGNDRHQYAAGMQAVLTIKGGTFSGGMNSIKNDDASKLTIENGSFTNTGGPTVMNWNEATINGGTFNSPNDVVIVNGFCDNDVDKGKFTINGGKFTANDGNKNLFAMGSGATDGGTLEINGGDFTAKIADVNQPYGVLIKGGEFTDISNGAFISSGDYIQIESAGGKKHYIGETDVEAALKNVKSGDTVLIMMSQIEDYNLPAGAIVLNYTEEPIKINGVVYKYEAGNNGITVPEQKAPTKVDAPKTGDDSNMMVPIAIALIALAGIATVVATRRKHN